MKCAEIFEKTACLLQRIITLVQNYNIPRSVLIRLKILQASLNRIQKSVRDPNPDLETKNSLREVIRHLYKISQEVFGDKIAQKTPAEEKTRKKMSDNTDQELQRILHEIEQFVGCK